MLLILLFPFFLLAGVLLAMVSVWVFCTEFLTVDIPAGINGKTRLRLLHCIFKLQMMWGTVLEKLRICSMPQFFRFMHDLPPLKNDPEVVVTDLHFGTIPVKLYQPKATSCSSRPGIVFYHGGGGIMGSLRTHHGICRQLCKESDSVVLSVGYRMVPQCRFPVLVRDSICATIHFLRSLKLYGVDPARVVVYGDSMGGQLASTVCQNLLCYPDLPKIRAQVLVYPTLQGLDFQSPSYQQNKNGPLVSLDFFFYCWCSCLSINPAWKSVVLQNAHMPPEVWAKYQKWLGAENIPEKFKTRGYQSQTPGPLNEDAFQECLLALDVTTSPLLAEDDVVSRLPEACIVSCEHDLFRDHALLYKKRLEDQGVRVTWHHVEDGFHGVLSCLDMTFFSFPCSRKILDATVRFINDL
ncbi:arylacetamide deacetylase-like 3 [Talpa occidentalis]|uniref:arylacetamide deacetylase-like 3 n=1 Tax=Talpa occidentalis TaxID=50954 RepID=UPI00188E4707|nr:arylacetamide deacetylase-like 3 [Talpa occidentalis]